LPKLLIFDLDETLIHSTENALKVSHDFQYEEYFVYKRPHLHTFLKECSKYCTLAIWSSADDAYVAGVSRLIVPSDVEMKFVWSRSQCWTKIVKREDEVTGIHRKEIQFIKPMERIRRKGYKMKDLMIIDDSSFKVIDNPGNYIIIKAFTGDQEDVELMHLLEYLKGNFF
jgi:carboxy-terminal domain RNA polymerase II polypeptide A small phosphatase